MKHFILLTAAALLSFSALAQQDATQAAQAEALKKHPELGKAGSAFNLEFVATVKRYQKQKPEYFKDPAWPLKLADEVAISLKPGTFTAVDSGFTEVSGGAIRHVAAQKDGKVIIFGSFKSVNGATRPGLARVNADGTVDAGFDPDPRAQLIGSPELTVPLADGKILLCGVFAALQAPVRLNSDGSVDTTFKGAENFKGDDIYSVTELPSRKLLVSSSADRVVQIKPDGTLDPTFKSVDGLTAVRMELAADNRVILACFQRKRLIRINLDGTLDPISYAEPDGLVRGVLTQKDGKTVIYGGFTKVGEVARNHIARLNADGTLDKSFDLDVTNNAEGPLVRGKPTLLEPIISHIAMQADGKIVIVGNFNTIAGMPRKDIARLQADGTLDTAFAPEIAMGYGPCWVAVQPSGKLVIAGGIKAGSGAMRVGLIRLNADGTLDKTFNSGSSKR